MSVHNVKRGDVLASEAEFYALPNGTEIVDIAGRAWKSLGSGMAATADGGGVARIEYPAMVRLVGSDEPEWLEVAAQAVDWSMSGPRLSADVLRCAAKAAVVAADKARGIANDRAELDALLERPSDFRWQVVGWAGTRPSQANEFPVVVR